MQIHRLDIKDPFQFDDGPVFDGITLVYHTSPHEYRKGEKVIWICHALTANSDPEDWWPQMVGPGKTIDTDRYFVVCVNMLGTPYGSTSPISTNPATGKPYFLDFPRVTVRDLARTLAIVRKSIGIDSVDLLIGSSIGGFLALEWSVIEPDAIKKAVFMATGARINPYLAATVESQMMAIDADQTFHECASLKGGEAGLRCARSIAVLSYRSFEGYFKTQQDKDDDQMFALRACTYQRYQGKKLSDRYDAYCYWSISWSELSHNLGRGRGGVQAALASIKADSYVVSIDSDCIFPPSELEVIAKGIPGARYRMITSDFGHDGFLLEYDQLTEILKPLL